MRWPMKYLAADSLSLPTNINFFREFLDRFNRYAE